MLKKIELIKLCCGRYVSQAQVASFFDEAPRIKEQFDYCKARATLLPFLPQREKQDHTYTHMFTPLIDGCGGRDQFVQKIKLDFVSIHSAPHPSSEGLLKKILMHAEDWLLNFATKNILMVPGNLRAALQTFEGGEVDEISHRCTYTMQHDPRSLLPELKKLLAFSYRRGLFLSRGFNNHDAFAVPYFFEGLAARSPSISVLPSLCCRVLSYVCFSSSQTWFRNQHDFMRYSLICVLEGCITFESSGLFRYLFLCGAHFYNIWSCTCQISARITGDSYFVTHGSSDP
jgi:hypothetical protein